MASESGRQSAKADQVRKGTLTIMKTQVTLLGLAVLTFVILQAVVIIYLRRRAQPKKTVAKAKADLIEAGYKKQIGDLGND